jgi:hypothetical protein
MNNLEEHFDDKKSKEQAKKLKARNINSRKACIVANKFEKKPVRKKKG